MPHKRSHLFGSLARITGAGIPVLRAGEILRGHSRDGISQEAMLALEAGIGRGESIAQSLRPALTEIEYRMVDAAETGGRLSAGFKHLEKYHALLDDARKKMRVAVAYPVLLLHMAALSSGVVANLNGTSPLTAMLWSLGVLGAVMLAVWFVARRVLAAAGKSLAADGVVRALPVAGGAWKNLALTRWSAVMHFHILSGRKFSAALEAAAEASGSRTLAAATQRLAAVAAAGGSIAEAMRGERVFPEYFATGFATAEATGTLDVETELQMNMCMEAATTSMAVLAEWLPRVVYFGAAIFVVWQIFRLAGSIGGQYQRAIDGKF